MLWVCCVDGSVMEQTAVYWKRSVGCEWKSILSPQRSTHPRCVSAQKKTVLIHQHAAKWCNWFLLALFGHVSYQRGPVSAAPFQMFGYQMQRCRLTEPTRSSEKKQRLTIHYISVLHVWRFPCIMADDW